MGEKIFITGPHEEGLNYFSDNSFGYYNPAFWEQVETVMEYSLENDGVFKQLGKYVYDQHLKKEAQLYYDSYQFLKDNASMVEKVSKEYQAAMKDDRMAGVVLRWANSTILNVIAVQSRLRSKPICPLLCPSLTVNSANSDRRWVSWATLCDWRRHHRRVEITLL